MAARFIVVLGRAILFGVVFGMVAQTVLFAVGTALYSPKDFLSAFLAGPILGGFLGVIAGVPSTIVAAFCALLMRKCHDRVLQFPVAVFAATVSVFLIAISDWGNTYGVISAVEMLPNTLVLFTCGLVAAVTVLKGTIEHHPNNTIRHHSK